MAKVIRKIGIVFFVIAISILLVVGCIVATNVTSKQQEPLHLNTQNMAIEDTTYYLFGSSEDMENKWNSIIKFSVETGKTIRVILQQDWVARDDELYTTTFGKGIGFGGCNDTDDYDYGSIYVPTRASIILDLNGYTINRNLTSATTNGRTIWVNGKMDLYDSSYSSEVVYKVFENDPAKLYDIKCGKITGAYTGPNELNVNSIHMNGAGIRVSGTLNLYGGMILNNTATGSCGGLASYGANAVVNIYDGLIIGNTATATGGGVMAEDGGILNLYNGIIYDNDANYHAGLYIDIDAVANLYGGIITGNFSQYNASGVWVHKSARLNINGGVQIYDNYANSLQSNLYLQSGQKIYIGGSLVDSNDVGKIARIAKIGINFSSDYDLEETFTLGYSYKNNLFSPSKYFFSSTTNRSMVLKNDEVALSTEADATLQKITWTYTDESTGTEYSTTNSTATVVYTGQNFKLKCSAGTFVGTDKKEYTEIKRSAVGSTCVVAKNDGYSNSSFSLIIMPKVVDIIWNDSEFIYNGETQIPTANIVEDSSCEVSMSGGNISAGKHIVTATGLTNDNYIISQSSKYFEYEIKPTNLDIDITTNNFESVYDKSNIDIGDNWYNYSTTGLLGQDSGKTLDSLFKIDKSAFIPQFTKDGITLDNVINKGEYAISVKEFDANKVFSGNGNYNVTINYVNGGVLSITEANVIRASVESGYSYLVLEDDKRVTYVQKGLLHGDNDSEIERYILGNIAPNTSVNEFLNNLVYDKTQIEIYNNKNKLIYNKGVAASGITEEMLNQKYELAVGTGWYIKTSVETIYLSVLGDVTGDGRISAVDVTYLRQIANDKDVYDNLSVEKKLASLVLNVGIVTTADAEIIRNIMDNKISIELFY